MSSLYICDDVLRPAVQDQLYGFVRNSKFSIGWMDTGEISRSHHQYLHSSYSDGDLENSGFLQNISDPVLLSKINGRRPLRCVVNLSVPCDVNFTHTHFNEDVLLFYVNTEWKEEWAGETMFYNSQRNQVEYCSVYKPNRAVFFDGEIPHSIRPQSIAAPHYRFTLSIFFAKE